MNAVYRKWQMLYKIFSDSNATVTIPTVSIHVILDENFAKNCTAGMVTVRN